MEVETGRHETDYTEMGAWSYAPPPPAYVPGEVAAGTGVVPGYYAPPPGYVGDGGVKGGASAAVGQSGGVGAPAGAEMSAEERERAQEMERDLDMRRPAQGPVGAQETGTSTAPVYR